MNRLFEALKDAADGAFVIDEGLRIIYWNRSAGAILGFDSDEVAGQFCYQLLHGYDEGRRLICGARCRVAELALRSKPVPNHDIHVKIEGGDALWLNMSVFTYKLDNADGKKVIVHLFHDLNHKDVDERVLTHLVNVVNRYQGVTHKNTAEKEILLEALTSREHEILSLLAKGHGTNEISKLLSVSTNTVRNHIQHIFQKLQVHTRLEAVTYAIEHGLIHK